MGLAIDDALKTNVAIQVLSYNQHFCKKYYTYVKKKGSLSGVILFLNLCRLM